jgi:hypothetical protein
MIPDTQHEQLKTHTAPIVCAAMLMDDGLIVPGVRHMSPDMRAVLQRLYGDDYKLRVKEQGFIATNGVFLDRVFAKKVAKAHGQIRSTDSRTENHPLLFSEDLY